MGVIVFVLVLLFLLPNWDNVKAFFGKLQESVVDVGGDISTITKEEFGSLLRENKLKKLAEAAGYDKCSSVLGNKVENERLKKIYEDWANNAKNTKVDSIDEKAEKEKFQTEILLKLADCECYLGNAKEAEVQYKKAGEISKNEDDANDRIISCYVSNVEGSVDEELVCGAAETLKKYKETNGLGVKKIEEVEKQCKEIRGLPSETKTLMSEFNEEFEGLYGTYNLLDTNDDNEVDGSYVRIERRRDEGDYIEAIGLSRKFVQDVRWEGLLKPIKEGNRNVYDEINRKIANVNYRIGLLLMRSQRENGNGCEEAHNLAFPNVNFGDNRLWGVGGEDYSDTLLSTGVSFNLERCKEEEKAKPDVGVYKEYVEIYKEVNGVGIFAKFIKDKFNKDCSGVSNGEICYKNQNAFREFRFRFMFSGISYPGLFRCVWLEQSQECVSCIDVEKLECSSYSHDAQVWMGGEKAIGLDRDTDKEKRKVAEDICNFDPCGFGRERSTDKKVCKFSAGWCEVKR